MAKHDLVNRNWNLWLESHNGQRFLAQMQKNAPQQTTVATTTTTTHAANPPDKKKS